MSSTPSATTRLVALLGDPVEHSLSPRFQNAAFRAAGVDGVYLALRCDRHALPGLLRGIARAGGAGNVTVPHKAAAADAVDRRTAAVEVTGACNTFWLAEGEVWGDNTDVAGFQAAVRALLGRPASGARVLLLGAGGAARAVAAGLAADGAAEILVANRSADRAAELVRRFAEHGAAIRALEPGERAAVDLVVNSTSLGLRPDDPPPLRAADGHRFGAALDLVYAPGGTAWVRQLRARGVAAADGTEMLLHQGAAAFQRWWGIPAPLDAMRRGLLERA